MNRILLVLLSSIMWVTTTHSQDVVMSNYALASHPMEVSRIVNTKDNLAIEIILTNRVTGGFFCVNKSVSLTSSDSLFLLQMQRAEGMPMCPDVHNFNFIGEQLKFQLLFPAPAKNPVFVNLTENCNDNCFTIYGIVLDPTLNLQIDLAHDYFAKGKLNLAIDMYRKIIEQRTDYPFAISYFNLIHFLARQKSFDQAKEWYQKLKSTKFVDTPASINRLREMPYFPELL